MAKASTQSSAWMRWLALSAVVILLDQFTKVLIVGYYQPGASTRVTDYWNIVRAHNHGAAFSLLADQGGWQRWLFTGLAIGASALMVWMLRSHGSQRLFSAALALILGGAVGNVIDRMVHGYVVDFLDFHWAFLSPLFANGHFPAFNIADSAITLGAIGLLVDELLRVRRGKK